MKDEKSSKQCNHDDCKLARMALFDKETGNLQCAADDCTNVPAAIISSSVDILYLCYFHAWKYLSLKIRAKVADIILEVFPSTHGEHPKGS